MSMQALSFVLPRKHVHVLPKASHDSGLHSLHETKKDITSTKLLSDCTAPVSPQALQAGILLARIAPTSAGPGPFRMRLLRITLQVPLPTSSQQYSARKSSSTRPQHHTSTARCMPPRGRLSQFTIKPCRADRSKRVTG